MKSDEIDKIIADALQEQQQHNAPRRGGKRSKSDNIKTIRKVLNIIFMIGFLAAVIIYFALPDQKALFFSLGFGSILLKLIEFYLRFMF